MFLPERLPDLIFSHFFRNFTGKVRFWTPLGAELGPKWRPKSPKWHQKCIQKTPGADPKWLQNRTFEPTSALGPSKNDLWEGGWKKHDIFMKIRCENRSFLMAQNYVWRYTLCLFHTFAIFEKDRKMEPKREAGSHVFSSKNTPWAQQGRLIHPSCSIFEGSKNRRFFDVDLEGQKIYKN